MFDRQINMQDALNDRESAFEDLISILSESSPEILDAYLEDKMEPFIPNLQRLLQLEIRKQPNKFAMAVPASALKYRNIPPILNCIISYLPAPRSYAETLRKEISLRKGKVSETEKPVKGKTTKSAEKKKKAGGEKDLETLLKDSAVFFVFKRQLHPDLGHLAYGRLYCGNLHHGLAVKSLFSEVEHKIGNIYRVRANEFSEVKSVGVGDIVCISVPEQVQSGDYIISGSGSEQLKEFLPAKYKQPKPVFISSLLFDNPQDRQ